jgi:hypothetical protein
MLSTPKHPNLCFGERFKVRSRRGKLYVLTFLQWADMGVYVRLGNGDIARLDSKRVEWSSWAAASSTGAPVLGDGDDVLVEYDKGTVQGRLIEFGASLTLRVRGGRNVEFQRDDVKTLYLLFRARKLKAGDTFIARTLSGSDLRGHVVTLTPEGLATVDLADGTRVNLAVAGLDPNTLNVLIPVPLDDLVDSHAGLEGVTILSAGPPKSGGGTSLNSERAGPSERDLFLCCNVLSPVELVQDKPLIVGRSLKKADVVLPHKGVSRQHAEFVRKGNGLYVRDLGTLNGTFVNGQRLGTEPLRLAAGDEVQIESFYMCIKEFGDV